MFVPVTLGCELTTQICFICNVKASFSIFNVCCIALQKWGKDLELHFQWLEWQHLIRKTIDFINLQKHVEYTESEAG